jgi:hypothetical protein
MVRYTLEYHVFLYVTYMKYGSARKCLRKFRRKSRDERVTGRQTIHNLLNKLRRTGLLIDKKQKHKCRVLIEEKVDDIGTRLEHTPRKSLKRLSQETGVSKYEYCARTATPLLKPSTESWCLVCYKCKNDCWTCVFNETICRGDSIFNTPCDLWIVTTSFQMLLAVRHADSLAKFACASQQVAHRSQWSAESWTRQVTKNIPLYLYAWG